MPFIWSQFRLNRIYRARVFIGYQHLGNGDFIVFFYGFPTFRETLINWILTRTVIRLESLVEHSWKTIECKWEDTMKTIFDGSFYRRVAKGKELDLLWVACGGETIERHVWDQPKEKLHSVLKGNWRPGWAVNTWSVSRLA